MLLETFFYFITEEIALEMTAHPPFLIPQENGCIDLNHPPDDGAFWKIFKELHPLYGVTEGTLYIFIISSLKILDI